MAYAKARDIALDSIPVIDIGALVAREPAGSAAAGAAMREASERIGFFYVTNHGVPETLTQDAFTTARAFFDLPAEAKESVRVNPRHRGWVSTGGAKMYGTAKPDLKESFVWGLELPEQDPDVAAGTPLMVKMPACAASTRKMVLSAALAVTVSVTTTS